MKLTVTDTAPRWLHQGVTHRGVRLMILVAIVFMIFVSMTMVERKTQYISQIKNQYIGTSTPEQADVPAYLEPPENDATLPPPPESPPKPIDTPEVTTPEVPNVEPPETVPVPVPDSTPAKSTSAELLSAANRPNNDLAPFSNEVLVQPRMSIAKLTLYWGVDTDMGPIYARAVQTHEYHNKIHGYGMHVLHEFLLPEVWNKPAYIMGFLAHELAKPEAERLKWIFWVDADSIIMNPLIPLEIFLPPPEFDYIQLLTTYDSLSLNNGLFPIRVSEWSLRLMSAIVSFPHYNPTITLPQADQSAMQYLLEHDPYFMANVSFVPQRWFNSYRFWRHDDTGELERENLDLELKKYSSVVREGDMALHFLGKHTTRGSTMTKWMDRWEKHDSRWEKNVEDTVYPKEIEAHWENERKALKEGKTIVGNGTFISLPGGI